MLSWTDAQYFLATARTGSTLAAARQLGVDQTTVARRIAALEKELSTRLFHRHQQGYRISEAGSAILGHVERMAEEAEALSRLCAEASRRLSGVVRITTTEPIANNILTPLLSDFMELHPSVDVEVIVAPGPVDLAKGEADLSIRAGPTPSGAGITIRKLAEDRWSMFCSQTYAARHGTPRSANELTQHIIIGAQGFLAGLAPFRWLARQAPDARSRVAANTIANALAAVGAGHGVGPLPCAVKAFEGADFIECFVLPPFDYGYYLVTREDIRDVPHIREFTGFLLSHAPALKRMLEGVASG
ncbi:LysR family transcriptional regulator [Sphingomonas sp. ASV193]|uniref:LysR family transcriptional regulator n=1 Tax=Sphingomonas sp. ASV193 TaxID=3144405 RepID=UPI0032E8CB5D